MNRLLAPLALTAVVGLLPAAVSGRQHFIDKPPRFL